MIREGRDTRAADPYYNTKNSFSFSLSTRPGRFHGESLVCGTSDIGPKGIQTDSSTEGYTPAQNGSTCLPSISRGKHTIPEGTRSVVFVAMQRGGIC